MSTARNIKGDRGLNIRMFTTGLLLVLLYGAVVGILIAVGISYVLVLVIAGVLLFGQYWFSDKIALFGMGGKIVTPEQAPELHGVIDRLGPPAAPHARGGLCPLGPDAPAGRARARGRVGPRALPRGPPGRGRDDHRQLPRCGRRPGHPDHVLVGDDGRLRR